MSHSDDKPVGWTNPRTGAHYARNVEFVSALDNYEPVPRRTGRSLLEEWRHTDGTVTYAVVGWGEEKDAHHAVYLIDNGRAVVPHYVAGFSQDRDRIMIRPFPTDYGADGERRTRDDNGRPVDFSNWMLGPRRAYHFKITTEG